MARTVRVRHPKSKLVESGRSMIDETPAEQPEASDKFLAALDGMSLKQLTAVIDKATEIRAAKIDEERKEFLDRVRAEATELGISLAQIAPASASAPRRSKPNGKSQAEIKYQGPNQGDTWTGRGRLPNWLAAIETEGRSRDEFLVNKPSE